MRYFILVICLTLSLAACASQQQVVMTPEIEEQIKEEPEEEDRIIELCRGMFESHSTGYTVYCILRNLYDMKQVERMYMDRLITADQFRECLDPSYFPEYQTFWYPEVLRCLEEKINVEK